MSDYTVALISHEYPPYTIGGIASYCLNLAKALSKRHIQTIVFCGVSNSMKVSQVNDYLRVVRLPCLDVPPRYLWFQIENFGTISKLIGDNCVLHAVNPNSSAFFLYLKKKRKLPFVTTLHEHPLAALKEFVRLSPSEWSFGDFRIYAASYPLDTFLMRECLRNSDHIVVPGESTKDYLVKVDAKISNKKISVIYNGVDLEEINGIESKNKRGDDLRIMSYGRLVSTKGIMYLLKIMPKLFRKFPKLNVQIVGKGPLENKIASQISDLNIQDGVHLSGFLQHSQLIREIKSSDVVVLPTFHEVGPFISALEAMACSKPVVVFDFCFSREFVVNMKNGLMAKPLDMGDLYDKVSMALSDDGLRRELGQNAYDYVEKHHNWNTLVEKYIEIYEESLHR
jgi:glycosyltransferase involved in cell wall biosynthesis